MGWLLSSDGEPSEVWGLTNLRGSDGGHRWLRYASEYCIYATNLEVASHTNFNAKNCSIKVLTYRY